MTAAECDHLVDLTCRLDGHCVMDMHTIGLLVFCVWSQSVEAAKGIC